MDSRLVFSLALALSLFICSAAHGGHHHHHGHGHAHDHGHAHHGHEGHGQEPHYINGQHNPRYVHSDKDADYNEFKEANPYEKKVQELTTKEKVVIFSKSYCPYCARAKQIFAELKVTPVVLELDQIPDGPKYQEALLKITGRRTVPSVWIDGKCIGGSDDTSSAHQSGELAKKLGIK